ncbi:MAG: fused DSP-PTPase phosphatase/NAD kinase-like protein, partial [Planctomycetia bacterium]
DNYHPLVVGEVYRSAQPDPAMLKRVARKDGIRTVVNLRGAWPRNDWYVAEKEAADELGLELCDVNMMTHQLAPLVELRRLVKAFDERPKPLLIHCRRGADRTSLASAIYMILYHGATPDQARAEQYKLAYGHIGTAFGGHLPHLFDCYADWLKLQGETHSAEAFRRWIDAETTLSYFGAKINLAKKLNAILVDRSIEIPLRVKNTSRYSWALNSSPAAGFHLTATFQPVGTPRGDEPVKTIVPLGLGESVPAGAEVVVRVNLPAEVEPGDYVLEADVVDPQGFPFRRMTNSLYTRTFTVAPAPVDLAGRPADPVRR